MNKKFLLLLFLFVSLFSIAQYGRDSVKHFFSLQQAIDFAMKNQSQVQNVNLDEQIAQYKVKEIIGMGFPQLNANISSNDFLEIPTTVIPAQVFNPSAAAGEFMAVQFGIQYNASAGIDASQIVFSSDYLIGLKATKTFLELAKKASQRTKIEVSAAVAKAYYSVLLNEERIKLIDAHVVRLKKLLDDTQVLNNNGIVEKIDLDRITVAYNNILAEKDKIERLATLGNTLLKFQMGMEQKSTLALTDKLTDIKFTYEFSEVQFEYGKRVEFSLLQTQKSVALLRLQQNKMHYLPTVALFGSFSTNAYRTQFDFFDTQKGWYPTMLIGGKISIGIFDGLQNHHRIQQSKLDILKAENNLKMIQQSIDLEISAAKTNLQNAITSLNAQSKNIEIAEGIYKSSMLKYEQGAGSNLEVMNAETSLKESQTNYFSALFDALIAKIDYDKANGNIK